MIISDSDPEPEPEVLANPNLLGGGRAAGWRDPVPMGSTSNQIPSNMSHNQSVNRNQSMSHNQSNMSHMRPEAQPEVQSDANKLKVNPWTGAIVYGATVPPRSQKVID